MIARTLTIALVVTIAGCSGRGDDPYEPLNRGVHAFNVGLDQRVVRPLTNPLRRGDSAAAEEPSPVAVADSGEVSLAQGLANVGSNLSLPGKSVNSLLQGKPGAAAQNAGRFIVNSTLGLLGTLDPAGREFALTEVDTDFGQTLQVWGVPEGAYLELPILGPSSERDTVGRVVDWVIDPLSFWLDGDALIAARGVQIVGKAADRARYGDALDDVLDDSADSYTQTRLIYQQHRRHQLGEEAEAIDPYSE